MLGDFRVTDVLGLLVILMALGYIIANRRILPGGLRNRFFLAFMLFTGQILSANLERVLFPLLFNLLEHAFRAGFSVMIAVACWSLGGKTEEETP